MSPIGQPALMPAMIAAEPQVSVANRIVFVFAGLGGAVLLPPDSDLELAQPPRVQDEASPTPTEKPALPETVGVTIMPSQVARPITLSTPPAISTSALQLQGELKRVGCYAGELDGIWGPTTQGAMKAFTKRVNAELPTGKPDAILLALVQAHSEKVCGVPCPRHQALTADGQCIPDALIALGRGAKVRASPATPAAGAKRRAIADAGSARKPPRPHAAAKREQRRSSEQGRWAQSFFKQQDRFGLH
jgi:peptidoglycan hydrolase-like protein with peptidoglycan-binding domain